MLIKSVTLDKFLIPSLLLNVQDHTFLILIPANYFILAWSYAKVQQTIIISLYFLFLYIVMVKLFEHIDEGEDSLAISNKHMPAILEALYSTHPNSQFIIIKVPIFELVDGNEVYVPSVSLFVVPKNYEIAVL
jgi:hypothetical protein